MTIIIKNKETLIFEGFKFKCCIGKKGTTKDKIEGDIKTPKGKWDGVMMLQIKNITG